MSSRILIAESGSTKTNWVLLGGRRKGSFDTQGLHPYLQSAEEIVYILENELALKPSSTKIDELFFYGAGVNSADQKKIMVKALKTYFGNVRIHTEGDMLAAARAACKQDKGIVCILGTGSNSCYYNGKRISSKLPSLGYILGDEGSGNHIGKRLLQYYFQGLMEEELAKAFEKAFDVSLLNVLDQVYRKPFANRYLARFAKFAIDQRGHFMIENIIEDCLNDFFINNLLHYKQIHDLPVHFSGSVAYYFQDVLQQLCSQYEIEIGQVIQRPITELAAYHQSLMK